MTLTITLTPSLPLTLSLTSSMAKSPKPSAVPVGAEADALHATGALVAKPLGLTHASRLS